MAEPTSILILCSTPHLDWDWLLPFPTLCDNSPPNQIHYFEGGVKNGPAFHIFDKAVDLLAKYPTYTYSICEIGFLRAYIEENPTQIDGLKRAGGRLEILGGGITSPDNLLPHGEAFIRNYLIGNDWARSTLGLSPRQAWLPDDFGHDAQLPVLLRAMGFDGVAFWRIPGGSGHCQTPKDGSLSLYQQFTETKQPGFVKQGDFIWVARDGSDAVAHWLSGGYQQGRDVSAVKIGDYISANAPISPTRNLFVPVGDDFMLPVPDLTSYVEDFNRSEHGTSAVAKLGTFDEFVQSLKSSGQLPKRPFQAQPYWMGFYQTRPRLKRLHHGATRALLGAEAFAVLAGSQLRGKPTEGGYLAGWEMEVQGRAAALKQAWDALAPSTHHDYITGTGAFYVYRGEQIPRLEAVEAAARAMRDGTLREIAANIDAKPVTAGAEVAVAVFNQLGFARDGLASLHPPPDMADVTFTSVLVGSESRPVQRSAEGDWLFDAEVGSLGYATAYLSSAPAQPPSRPASVERTGTAVRLTNGILTAEIDVGTGDIRSIAEAAEGAAPVVADRSNAIVFYDDGGDNYQYEGETDGSSLSPATVTIGPAATRLEVIERGPLRVRLRCFTTYTITGGLEEGTATYVREYALGAGEPMLRMRTTGACPFGYSAMVSFGTRDGIATLAHGTTYHWDDVPLVPYVLCPSMQVTHDFVIPEAANGAPLFAIYHDSMPAWGQVLTTDAGGHIQPSTTLLGGLSRNPSGNYFNWGGMSCMPAPPDGIDPDCHTFDYALRLPSGLSEGPSTGLPLREALGYTTPLLAVPIPVPTSTSSTSTQPPTRMLPTAFSLASVSADGASQPIITAAKPAESDPNALVLRIYQASNAPMDVKLCLAGLVDQNGQALAKVKCVTALEQPDPSGATPTGSKADYAFTAALALSTIWVEPAQGKPRPTEPAR